MTDLIQPIKTNVRTSSDRIREIKTSALKTTRRTIHGYLKPDGTMEEQHKMSLLPFSLREKEDLTYGSIEVDFVLSHINPRHKDWAEYKKLKMEVSLWLAALHFVKNNQNEAVITITSAELGPAGYHRPKRIGFEAFSVAIGKKIKRLQKKLAKEVVLA